MQDKEVNWTTIQNKKIKENWGCPVGWRTLYTICSKEHNHNTNLISKLLDFYGIPNTTKYGFVTILNVSNESE
jgi:hypothetical protein